MTDSSMRLIAENCRDAVGEIVILGERRRWKTLTVLLEDTEIQLGGVHLVLGTVNIVHGEPARNEPRAAIIYGSDVVILQDPVTKDYVLCDYRKIQ